MNVTFVTEILLKRVTLLGFGICLCSLGVLLLLTAPSRIDVVNDRSGATTTPVLVDTHTAFDESPVPPTEDVYHAMASTSEAAIKTDYDVPHMDPQSHNRDVTLQEIPAPLAWGMYVGWQRTTVAAAEHVITQLPDLYATSIHWGNERSFPSHLAGYITNPERSTVVIFWNPSDYTRASTDPYQLRYGYDAIVRGEWDTYISTFFSDAAQYPGTVIIVPFEEVNLSDTPWACGSEPACQLLYIGAFQHISSMAKKYAHIKVAWVVNHLSVPNTSENSIMHYYPGAAYVDVVGVNGFNFGTPYQDFDTVFNDALTTIVSLQKPVYIFSMASREGPEKISWIHSFLKSRWFTDPQLKGWIWFNENKERDWRITDSPELITAFETLVERGTER